MKLGINPFTKKLDRIEVGVLRMVKGGIYGAINLSDLGAGAPVTADRLYLTPIKITHPTTFDEMGFRHAANDVGSITRCGIYRDNQGIPTELVDQTVDIDTGSGAVTGKSGAFVNGDLNLSTGWYWLALVSSGIPSIHFMSASDNLRMVGFRDFNDVGPKTHYLDDTTNFGVTGVLPDSLDAGNLVAAANSVPDTRIQVKA